MKIFDKLFAHAESAGSPWTNIEMPFEWERGTCSISPNEPVFFTESEYQLGLKLEHNNKILWVLESPAFVPASVVESLKTNHGAFKNILSHDDRISYPNTITFPVGGCWIHNKDCLIYPKVKNSISTIVSTKRDTDGQRLRHRAAGLDIHVFGPQYLPLDYKLDALKDFQYHICIENTQSDYYFSEKLIDCFVTGTVPIYWGAKKISTFFDDRAIIKVNSFEELQEVVREIHRHRVHQGAVENNFNIAKEYKMPEERIHKYFSGG